MAIVIKDSELLYFRKRLMEWGRENFKDFPWRNLTNQWHSLVVEMMLQRTRAEQVEPIFLAFARAYPRPEDYLAHPIDIFAHLGLPQRNIWIKALAEQIVNTNIPSAREELLELPGVGDYIASAFRSFHINKYDRIVDSNVVRIYGRFFGFETDGETRRKRWFLDLAERLTPIKKHREYNYALLDFTREVCAPIPRCPECILQKRCAYFRNSLRLNL